KEAWRPDTAGVRRNSPWCVTQANRLSLDLARIPEIVGVEKSDEVPAAVLNPQVSRGRQATIFRSNHLQRRPIPLIRRLDWLPRPIVDDHDLANVSGLRADR